MRGLMITLDDKRMLMEFGNITNFAKENDLNKDAVYALLKRHGKPTLFQPNSLIKQTYDKLRQMGYVIE
ncbi:hypothetical protein [Campylobacter curvus]|mgnify:CR=1 FL=1|uniref:Uncharacterized protein n=1 Tax=Campylobacter curvus (strain 525.92) TaxID=360105 RepID=A7GY84_CAMC5|nr:hypothetical protein [Campylobacter curvus]EAU00197.2 hypothetical protein CCV52592_1306 [Campylobacter curvus 525.92]